MRRWRRFAPLLVAFVQGGALAVSPPSVVVAAPSDADRHWLVGLGAFEDGLWDVAARELGRFLPLAGGDSRRGDATFLRGRALLALDRPAEALPEFEAAETYPLTRATPGEPIFWQGEALFRLRRLAEARDRYAKYLALRPLTQGTPFVPEALYARGFAELELGHADAAVASFQELLRDYPTHERAATAAYSAGRELVRARRFEEALPLLASYATRYPSSPYLTESRYLLGVAQLEAGRPEGIRTLDQFVTASPSQELVPTARVLIAEAQVKAGRLREAIDQYQALVRTVPTHALVPQALFQVGELSLRLNRPVDAEAAWTTLRRDFPQHPLAAPAGLGTAQLYERRKQWDQAYDVAQAVAAAPGVERLPALLIAGQSALQLRKNAEAAQFYHAVVVEAPASSPERLRGLAGLALASELLNDPEAAKRAYRDIIDGGQDAEMTQWARRRLQALEAPPPSPPRETPRPKPKTKLAPAARTPS